MARPRQVAVIGSGSAEEGSETWAAAEEIGRRLAEAGVAVVCGGREGVMAAAARGAAGAGGTVIGIVPSDHPDHANEHCTHAVAAGTGVARNIAVVASGEAVVAVGGEWGTLSEIALARRFGRTVVTLASWRAEGAGEMASAPGIVAARDPGEAVAAALEAIGL
jgi:uncharacterized protein (TIGR00725 family)